VARKKSITIVGPGNVASVLAPALRNAGYRIDEIVSRDLPESIKRAKSLAKKTRAMASTLADCRLDADVIWICSTDDAIAKVARALATRRNVDWRSKIVLHASSAVTSDELKALKKRGAAVASTHFMQSFAPGSNPTLKVPFSVEGDKNAREAALAIGAALGASTLVLPKRNRVLYHAIGAFSSPMVIASLSMAEELARVAGLSSEQTRAVIAPIFSRTAENFLRKGSAAAFGGPISRGNVATLRNYLQALKRTPEARAAFLALGKAAAKRLPAKNKKELKKLFAKG
jgi:predicted short-subunit dehydrogenase-like oxidoreductase (DUF2520 family)